MKIEILNGDEFKSLFKTWGTFAATCYNTPVKYAERVGKHCLSSGHMSSSRSTYINFKISGISRACADQMVRHEQGVVKNMQSQRYVDGDFEYYIDPLIEKHEDIKNLFVGYMENLAYMKGFLKEKLARYGYSGEKLNQVTRGLNPMAIHTELSIGFTVEALMHFMNERLCTCAQDEIREVAKLMKKLVLELVPELEEYLVPKCEKLLWCPEDAKRCCGRKPVKAVLIDRMKLDG